MSDRPTPHVGLGDVVNYRGKDLRVTAIDLEERTLAVLPEELFAQERYVDAFPGVPWSDVTLVRRF